jgi:hypothetical protein
MALRQLRSDARRAARGAMDYLASGGRVESPLTVMEREKLRTPSRAQANTAADEWNQSREASISKPSEKAIAGPRRAFGRAVGVAAGRPIFLPSSPAIQEPSPAPASHPSASAAQQPSPADRPKSSRKRVQSHIARQDPALGACEPVPLPAVPFPPWFGLCPQRAEPSLKLPVIDLFRLRSSRSPFRLRTGQTDEPAQYRRPSIVQEFRGGPHPAP